MSCYLEIGGFKMSTLQPEGELVLYSQAIKIINELELKNIKLERKLAPAIKVRDAYMTQDTNKIMKAIGDMRHVWNEVFEGR